MTTGWLLKNGGLFQSFQDTDLKAKVELQEGQLLFDAQAKESLRAELTRRNELIKKYGQHLQDCALIATRSLNALDEYLETGIDPRVCTCGFADADKQLNNKEE